jgi:hypothetical protein
MHLTRGTLKRKKNERVNERTSVADWRKGIRQCGPTECAERIARMLKNWKIHVMCFSKLMLQKCSTTCDELQGIASYEVDYSHSREQGLITFSSRSVRFNELDVISWGSVATQHLNFAWCYYVA